MEKCGRFTLKGCAEHTLHGGTDSDGERYDPSLQGAHGLKEKLTIQKPLTIQTGIHSCAICHNGKTGPCVQVAICWLGIWQGSRGQAARCRGSVSKCVCRKGWRKGSQMGAVSPLPVKTAKEHWSQSRSQRAGKVHGGRGVTEINSN